MALKVAINGFGRIGRMVFRAGYKNDSIEFIAINDLTEPSTLAHLLKYDSVHGVLDSDISSTDHSLIVDGREIEIFKEKEPAGLGWGDLGVETVLECTGLFRDRDKASGHLEAGAKKVIISAPAKGPDVTIVMGVNHQDYDPGSHHIVSKRLLYHKLPGPAVQGSAGQFRNPKRPYDHYTCLYRGPAIAGFPT